MKEKGIFQEMNQLKIEKLSFNYPSKKVLEDINFTVKSGESIAILGTNGVGKSTLLKCINRILNHKEGKVEINGENIKSLSSNTIAQKIGYVAQRNEFSRTSVFDAILLGRKPYIKWDVSSSDLKFVQAIMEKLSLSSFSMRNVNELSGGEVQKVAIARALAQEPSILLFDEPTSNLDLKNQLEVIKLIKSIVAENNISALVTMHDINLAARFANKFILMKNGTIFDFGGSEVLTKENIRNLYNVDIELQYHRGLPVVIPV